MNCPSLFLAVGRESTKSLCLLAAMKYHLKEKSQTEAFRVCLLMKNWQTEKRKVSLTNQLFVPIVQMDLLGRVTPVYPGTEFALPCFLGARQNVEELWVSCAVMTLHILPLLLNFKSTRLRQPD